MRETQPPQTPSVFDNWDQAPESPSPTSTSFQIPEGMLPTLERVADEMNQDPNAPQLSIGNVRRLEDPHLNGPERAAASHLPGEVSPRTQRVVTVFEQPQLPK